MRTARGDAYRSVGLALAIIEISRRLDDLAVRAGTALEAASIPYLLLRGPVFARWVYDAPAERPYEDVDLLVPRPRRAQAAEVLTGLGMTALLGNAAPSEQAPHATTFEAAEGDIDLHWTLRGIGARPQAVWDALSRNREQMRLADANVPVPAAGARAFTIALHAAQHGPQGSVQLQDAERAVRRLPRSTWEEAAALADELEAVPAFAAGVRLAPGGDALLRDLGIAAPMNLDLAVRAQGNVPVIRGLLELSQREGAVAKTHLVARELVPTPAFMRQWSSLADQGRLGLAAAYAIRPFWLARHLIPAYRALRRARGAQQ